MTSFSVAIEGSDEFDDDGEAEDIVTATVAGADASDTEDVNWSTEGPLNGGEVLIEFAADRFQDSGVLPQAPITDTAAYDVTVTDQFGNPVGGELVNIDEDGDGNFDDNEDSIVTDFVDNVEFTVSSNVEGRDHPIGTWDARSTASTTTARSSWAARARSRARVRRSRSTRSTSPTAPSRSRSRALTPSRSAARSS